MTVADGSPHRFRFFVAGSCQIGGTTALAPHDAAHVRVLRLGEGDLIEVVDADARCWAGTLDAARTGVAIRELASEVPEPREPEIHLYAGALVGNRFDQLVDHAVQAGATRIVPIAWTGREASRLVERADRLQRVALAAAKQAKRQRIPLVDVPQLAGELAGRSCRSDGATCIVLDSAAHWGLHQAVEAAPASHAVHLLVGPAGGIDAEMLGRFRAAGWEPARLGNSVLRSELAAGVAVATVAMVAGARQRRSG